jgi:hypothetical protein
MGRRGNLKAMVAIVLSIGLMSVLVGDSVESMPGMDTDLGDADASFWGETAEDEAGYSVASAGDVNGDGYDDILIGAPYWDDSSHILGEAGHTYLIFGMSSGWSKGSLFITNASFKGENEKDYSGMSVAGAGDVNGDGYDDILIGAPYNNDGGAYAGKAYLIFGKELGWSMNTDLSGADASFLGEARQNSFGWSVAGAGDVNGDGYDDILIGAWVNSEGGGFAGQTYLIFGKALGWSKNTDMSRANASFLGEDEFDHSGRSVAGAGDVNGDGYDDILIGARGNGEGGPSAGQTYLILGKELGWSLDTNLATSDASFWGEEAGDRTGESVAGAGDINGDGFDDILIGCFDNDEGGSGAGQTYLILGKALGWSMDSNLSNASASFIGEEAGDSSGWSVAGAGDVNADGYADILIGAKDNDESVSGAGQTYLILGNASGWSPDTNLSNPDASFLGENAGDSSGYSVASAGDVNGDGASDILIGARGYDYGGSEKGQTYLIFGVPVDTDDDGIPDCMDAFPGDIAASLDTDGDGFPDGWNVGKTQADSTTGLSLDAFPDDVAASMDTDDDGYPDEWNLGMSRDDSTSDPKLELDMFPDDPLEWLDTDDDGYGDNGDVFPNDPLEWLDTDGDGHGDNGDVFPNDHLEWVDTDGDGHGDNGDVFPNDPLEWADGDGDGYGDNSDVFPNDPLEWIDTDGDGHGDNGDTFPDDHLEWNDTDRDGYGDNGDIFPEDPLEWADADGDGRGDNGDVFPEDPLEWADSDGDGHGDNSDAFPNDPLEWLDTDGDGHGDNSDALPEDPNEWFDKDGDGHGDTFDDIFPDDPLEWWDTDDDGYGDNGDAFPDNSFEWLDTDGDDHGDNGDAFPDDPLEWNETGTALVTMETRSPMTQRPPWIPTAMDIPIGGTQESQKRIPRLD